MKLVDALLSLEDHPMLGARYRKVPLSELHYLATVVCPRLEPLDKWEVQRQINLWYLDQEDKPGNLSLWKELLSNALTIARGGRRR